MVGAPIRPLLSPRRLLIGVALSYIPFLALLATGYAGRLARSSHDGESPPAWDRWPALLARGIAIVLVALVYAAPYAIVETAQNAGETRIHPLVSQIILLLTIFFAPAALARASVKGNILSAFALGRVVRSVLSIRYLAAWIVWMALFLGAIVGVGFAPDWSFWFAPAAFFLLLAVGASLFGWAARERGP